MVTPETTFEFEVPEPAGAGVMLLAKVEVKDAVDVETGAEMVMVAESVELVGGGTAELLARLSTGSLNGVVVVGGTATAVVTRRRL